MSRSIKVLVCDDDPQWESNVIDELGELANRVEVFFFQDPLEAAKAAEIHNFQAAFIDIYYPVSGKDQDPLGLDLAAELARIAPSCKQVLMTRFGAKGFSQIFEYAWSREGNQPAIMNKMAERIEYFRDFIERNFSRWFDRTWEMPDVNDVAKFLVGVKFGAERVHRSQGEVEREVQGLLFDLFDEAASIAVASGSPSLRVEQNHFGQSGSIVLQTRIHYGEDENERPVLGTRCVVKIGSFASTAEEEQRYRAYVRMGVPSEFRVELLQTAYGDALGAICYSFAGGESDEIESFDEILVSEVALSASIDTPADLPRSNRIISELFDTKKKSWQAIVGKSEIIADFYNREFGTDFQERVRQMANFVNKQDAGNFDSESGAWSFPGFSLMLPTREDIGSGTWKKRSPTCLVHGDLHGGNVLINGRNTINMIDFANVSVGPRFVDSVALASTIRLQLTSDIPVGDYAKIYQAEQALWRPRTSEKSKAHFAEVFPWFQIANNLNKIALNNAARRHEDQAIEKELVMTQLCYALSVFGLPWLSSSQKVRLVIWASALKFHLIEELK